MEESPHSTTIMMIISTLTSLPSSLSHSISSLLLRRRRRLTTILSSPSLFSLTLLHLQSLSLHHKSLLIAHHLLSTLTFLKSLINHHHQHHPTIDLDSALLLLLLCEVDHHHHHLLDAPPSRWRHLLCEYVSCTILRASSLGGGGMVEFVEEVGRCWNLVDVMCYGGKEESMVTGTVVVRREVMECVICKEMMDEGSEVCELGCKHLFHWGCIVRWFGKRDTCPCCRRRMLAGDVRREIRGMLEELAEMGGGIELL